MGRCLFCLVLCIGWQYAASSPITVSEYEYVREADAWLRLHIVPATWADAAVLCQLEGGLLASPTSSAMAQSMVNTMKRRNLADSGVFIGATDLFSKGDFKLVDGADLAKSLEWAPREPDNADNAEDCLALTDEGTLYDVSCSKPLPYFCRKVTNCPSTPVTDDPREDYNRYDIISEPKPNGNDDNIPSLCRQSGYEWEPRFESCYKFHRVAKAFSDAGLACISEGGDLAIINSDAEHAVLKELFQRNPSHVITTRENPNYAYIGFGKMKDGVWRTLDGETLSQAGFNKWSPGEPNAYLQPEDCGSIFRDGLLNDYPCKAEAPFICEIHLYRKD